MKLLTRAIWIVALFCTLSACSDDDKATFTPGSGGTTQGGGNGGNTPSGGGD